MSTAYNQWTRFEEFPITVQIPETRIAWRSTDGPTHAGIVDFHRLSDDETRVMVVMDTEAEGMVEKGAGAVGLVKRRVRGDRERPEEMIESRREVPRDQAHPGRAVRGPPVRLHPHATGAATTRGWCGFGCRPAGNTVGVSDARRHP